MNAMMTSHNTHERLRTLRRMVSSNLWTYLEHSVSIRRERLPLSNGGDMREHNGSHDSGPTTTAAPWDRIDNTFGRGFAKQLAALPDGEWAGPVYSGFGAHVVFIESRTPARDPELDEVKAQVERDLLHQRRLEARAAFLDALQQKYTVIRPNDVSDTGEALARGEE